MSTSSTFTFTPRTSMQVGTICFQSVWRTSASNVVTPVGRTSGVHSWSLITGKPMTMAPAPTAYHESGIGPNVIPKAKIRSRLYFRQFRQSPFLCPPKVRALRIAQFST